MAQVDPEQIDHLEEAAFSLKVAGALLGEGHTGSAERWTAMAGVHAQIAQAEEARKLNKMLGRSTDGNYAEIGVDGHVTTGAP